MKDLLEQWEEKAFITIKKWEICNIIGHKGLMISITNLGLDIRQIKMLNRLMEENGWDLRVDNIDIYNGDINIWLY